MYSIRTAFLRNHQQPFTIYSSLLGILCTFFDGLIEEKRNKIYIKPQAKFFDNVKISSTPKLNYDLEISCMHSRLLARQINFHINSFSQLANKQMGDFKDCENLVHVLQIEEQVQIKLQELDSIESKYQEIWTTNGDKSDYDESSEVEDLLDESSIYQKSY